MTVTDLDTSGAAIQNRTKGTNALIAGVLAPASESGGGVHWFTVTTTVSDGRYEGLAVGRLPSTRAVGWPGPVPLPVGDLAARCVCLPETRGDGVYRFEVGVLVRDGAMCAEVFEV